MSLHTIDGVTPQFDLRHDRIAAGTIGGSLSLPHGLTASGVTSVVDDADPAINYGTFGGSLAAFNSSLGQGYTQRGTQTVIGGTATNGVSTSAAQLRFNGSSIGVIGGTNPFSGVMSVYIDGVLTAGRVPIMVGLHAPTSTTTPNVPCVAIGDTSVTALTIPSGFPSSGTILLGNELLTYSSKTSTVFTTSAATKNHYANETVYLWASSVDLSDATNFANKRLLYYNPFLTPGAHSIIIVVSTGATGFTRIYFDGFITGSLVGASNLFTQTGTIVASTSTSSNGHGDLGSFIINNSDVSIIAILGYTQTSPTTETDNTTILGKLAVKYGSSPDPFMYLHNGPTSTTVNLLITFMYIGESL